MYIDIEMVETRVMSELRSTGRYAGLILKKDVNENAVRDYCVVSVDGMPDTFEIHITDSRLSQKTRSYANCDEFWRIARLAILKENNILATDDQIIDVENDLYSSSIEAVESMVITIDK